MKKMYLTAGEITDRAVRILRELPLGWAFGIEFFTNGSHPPYFRIWCEGLQDGEVHEWILEDCNCDAEHVLKILNEMRKEVNVICNSVDIYESNPYTDVLDDEMPF